MINNYDNIIVLGAGGTGSILLPLLSRYLFSKKYLGHFTIVDGDNYSESNIERQIFGLSHININKAEYQAQVVAAHIPQLEDQINVIDKYLSKEDIDGLIDENCVIFNCTDNKAARKYVEDRCLQMNNAVHICCGNELRTGQVQISLRHNGEQVTPSIFESYPEFNDANDDRSVLSCEELAALPGGGQLIAANATAAVLALNAFVALTSSAICKEGSSFPYSEVVYGIMMNSFDTKELANA